MTDLETIERLYNIDTDRRRLRDGKKKANKNKYYYFKHQFYVMQVTGDKWFLLPDTVKTIRLMRSHFWCNDHGYASTSEDRHIKKWHQKYLTYEHPNVVDHINRRKFDNTEENLRITTSQENNRNRPINRNNTSGVQGTCKITEDGREYWLSTIRNENKQVKKHFSVLKFGDAEAKRKAIEQRKAWEIEFGYTNE